MNALRASIFAAIVTLPAFAFAQEGETTTRDTRLGVSMFATTNMTSFGLAVPIEFESFRLEPALVAGYEGQSTNRTVTISEAMNTSSSSSRIDYGVAFGLHGFIYRDDTKGAYVGADLGYSNAAFSQSSDTGGVVSDSGAERSESSLKAAVVVGGQLELGAGIHIGIRGGPQVTATSYETTDNEVEVSNDIATVGGYGRLDVVYCF